MATDYTIPSIIIWAFFALALAGCVEHEGPVCCVLPPDTSAKIQIQNGKGEDLLNSATPGSLTGVEIKVYFVIDGVKKPFYELRNYSQPLSISKMELDSFYSLVIPLNDQPKNQESLTILEFSGLRSDEITSHFPSEKNLRIDAVWLNGNAVADWNKTGSGRDIKIIVE